MKQRTLARFSCLAFMLSASPALGSTIQECIGHCSIFKWGPSRFDPIATERQAPQPANWNGHQGFYIFENLVLIADPYIWYDLAGYNGTGAMGPAVEVGWANFVLKRTWVDGVQFDWFDEGFEGDVNHYHRSTVTAPTVTSDTAWHSQYLWQCEVGIDPPYPAEPWPEPAAYILTGSGLVALAALRRSRLGIR